MLSDLISLSEDKEYCSGVRALNKIKITLVTPDIYRFVYRRGNNFVSKIVLLYVENHMTVT